MIKLNIRETNEYTREDRKGYNMSSSVAQPIIKQIDDNKDALDFFEKELLPKENEKTQEIIANFPTVYIHNWQESGDY